MSGDVGDLTVRVAMDNSNFQQGVQNLNRSLKVVQSDFKATTASLGEHGKGMEGLKAKSDMLSKSIDIQGEIVSKYKDKLKESKDTLEKNKEEHIKLKDKVDSAKRAFEESEKTLGKNSEETKKLKSEYEDLNKKYDTSEEKLRNNVRTMDNWEIKANNATSKLEKLKGELEGVNQQLDKSQNKWLNTGKSLEETSTNLDKIGTGVKGAGDKILTLSAPLVLAATASSKFSKDFNEAMANVGTLIPGNRERLQELKSDVQEVGIAVGKSTDDIADGTYQVISAFGDTADTMEKVELNAKGATAGVASTTDALNLSSAVMKGYGDTTAQANEKVLDLAFNTVKLGQTSFAELSSSIGKVVPLSKELIVSQEEMFTVFATGTGVTGTASEVSTQYRGVLQSLLAPTKDMTGLIKEMGVQDGKALIEKQGLAGAIETIVSKAKETNTPLQKYIGSIEGQTLALALAGEQSETYKTKLEEMKNSAGAMEEAFKEQTEGINEQGFTYEQAMIKMQVSAQKFGDAVAPIMGKGAELLGNIADKISAMDGEQLEFIANLGLLTVGVGGFLSVGGRVISGAGTVIGLAGKLSTAIGGVTNATTGISTATSIATGAGGVGGLAGLATGLGGVISAVAPFVLGAGLIAGGGYLIKKVMTEETVPAVDLFADKVTMSEKAIKQAQGGMGASVEQTTTKISNATREQVGAYMKLDEQATQSLTNLYVKGTKITTDTANNMLATYANMGNTIKTGMDQKHNEQIASLQTFFQNSKNISKQERDNMLADLEAYNTNEKAKIDNQRQEIQAILNKASQEKRSLTLSEQQQISEIQENMKVTAINKLSESEIESKVILERLKGFNERITAEQASEVIKNAEKQRQGAKQEAEQQYKETVANIIKMRDETGVISAEQAEKLIQEAERQRSESIKKAEYMKKEVVKKVETMNKDISDSVDINSGKILSTWDKLKTWWEKWKPESKEFTGKVTANETTRKIGGNYGRIPDNNWTGNNNFKGGLSYVGEKGRELLVYPGGGIDLTANQTELRNLPRGTRIFNNSDTEKILTGGTGRKIPGFAKGNVSLKSGVQNTSMSLSLDFSSKDNLLKEAKKFGEDFSKAISESIENNSDIEKILEKKLETIKATNKITEEKLKEQLEQLKRQEQLKLREIKDTKAKNALKDEYYEKKKAIEDQIKLRKKQADEEIKELKRITDEYKSNLKEEENARKEFVSKVNIYSTNIVNALKKKYSEEFKLKEESINKEISKLEEWKNESLERINSVYDTKMKRLEDSSNAQIKAIENELKALEQAEKKKDRDELDKRDSEKINRLKTAIEFEHNDFNKIQLQKELDKAIEERDKRKEKEELEDKKIKLREEIERIKEQTLKKKEILDQEKLYESTKIQELYAEEKEALNKRLESIKEHHTRRTEEARLQAEAEKMIMKGNQDEIVALLQSYGEPYKLAGQTLGDRLLNGMKPKIDEINKLIDSLERRANSISGYSGIGGSSSSKGRIVYTASKEAVEHANKIMNNKITINSPRAISHSEALKKATNSARKLAFGF